MTWERVRRVLTDPARTTAGPPRRYLLTGLLVCGLCGVKLVARPKADGRPCVVCASGTNFGGCGKIRQLTEPLDALVVDAVLAEIESPGVAARLAAPADDVGTELAEVEARLVELAEDWADGALDRRSWAVARRRLDDRADTLRRSMVAAPVVTADVRARWEHLAVEQRRAVVASVVERIVIGPAVRGRNVFDSRRVSIVWR